jgi:beta-lactamase class A
MKYRARAGVVVVFSSLVAACSGNAVFESDSRPRTADNPSKFSTNPTPTPYVSPPRPAIKPDSELAREIQEIATNAEGKVGVAAVMLETGQAVELDADGHYPSQSVYKVPISMAVLKLIDEGKASLDQQVVVSPEDFVRWGFHSPIRNLYPQGTVLPVSDLLRASVSDSDGTANDVLLEMAGGPAKVQEYLSTLGIKDFIVADSEKSISKDWETQYRNWATPSASIELLWQIYERKALSDASTDLLLQIMTNTPTAPKRLQRGLPDGASLAHKTGTGGTKNRTTSATNDIGIVTLPDGRHIAIAVYIMDSSAPAATRNDVTGEILKAAIRRWAPDYATEDEASRSKPSQKRPAV